MKRLNEKGMSRLGEIQVKYRFMDSFELENDDVYEFCSNIMKAYELGLNLEDEDKNFIDMIFNEVFGWYQLKQIKDTFYRRN